MFRDEALAAANSPRQTEHHQAHWARSYDAPREIPLHKLHFGPHYAR
jgi:hypothetical protein